jgi:hypothetical protein
MPEAESVGQLEMRALSRRLKDYAADLKGRAHPPPPHGLGVARAPGAIDHEACEAGRGVALRAAFIG